MEIGILGTGGVAQTLARRWSVAGHQVTLGSRDPSSKGDLGSPVAPLIEVVADHDVVVNATPGSASLELAKGIGAAALAGKILIDVANANTPSFELVYPNSSLAEKLQAALPETHVVENHEHRGDGGHDRSGHAPASSVFVSGDDPGAKATVTGQHRFRVAGRIRGRPRRNPPLADPSTTS
jgi:8-hydroxy-5-deazaflavin:NADPH oxidoreductase